VSEVRTLRPRRPIPHCLDENGATSIDFFAPGVHDVERDRHGISLDLDTGSLDNPRKGHEHHIDASSAIARAGGIPAAVDDGVLASGVMYECERAA